MPSDDRPLTVVLVHNRYQQPGGEDAAVEADAELLSARGHRVVRHERSNDEIDGLGPIGRARVAAGTVWSVDAARRLGRVIDDEQPDVVHVHNTFPLLSPSVFPAARRRGVPVVQTVHNFRLVCAAATCSRDGHRCVECLDHALPWPAIRYGCYHGSRAQTAVVTAMEVTHRVARTWARQVDLHLAVSAFARDRLVGAGALPGDRVMVRHNFCTDPGVRDPAGDCGGAVFAGRIDDDKGVDVLVRAASLVPQMPVVVVGDGPARASAEDLARRLGAINVTFPGRLPKPEVFDILRRARCVVLPSVCDESFGLVLAEAAALGVPAVASRVGGVPEVVAAGAGELVAPGDPHALASALAGAAGDPDGWHERGAAARRHYEEAFTAERAYDQILVAYRRAGVGREASNR
jgi:glycosyltransferase involved in cell wall biosynthesis